MLQKSSSLTNEEKQQREKIIFDEFAEEGFEVKIYKSTLNDEQRIKKDIEIKKNILEIITSLNTGN